MKKIRIRKSLSEHLIRNKWQYLCALLSLILGVIAGSLTASMTNANEFENLCLYINNFVSAYNLQSVNGMEIFKFSVYNNIKVILFMWLSGLWIWFMPVSVTHLGLKGYKLGLSMTAFIRIFGLRGIIFSAVSTLPQILFLIPALVIYAVFNMNFSMSLYRMKRQKATSNTKNEMYFKNFLHLLGIIAVSVMCSLVDAFVMPIILKPICSFLIG